MKNYKQITAQALLFFLPFTTWGQTDNCADDNHDGVNGFNNGIGCTSSSVKFQRIASVSVFDPGATQNAQGIWEGACRGNDDFVAKAFLEGRGLLVWHQSCGNNSFFYFIQLNRIDSQLHNM